LDGDGNVNSDGDGGTTPILSHGPERARI
jgi:hypothetical protein